MRIILSVFYPYYYNCYYLFSYFIFILIIYYLFSLLLLFLVTLKEILAACIFNLFGPSLSWNIMESGDCFCQLLFVCCVNHLYINEKK